MIATGFKDINVIDSHLTMGDFGRSGSHWVKGHNFHFWSPGRNGLKIILIAFDLSKGLISFLITPRKRLNCLYLASIL